MPRQLEGKAVFLDRKNALMVADVFDCNGLWFLLSRCRLWSVVLAGKRMFVEFLTRGIRLSSVLS